MEILSGYIALVMGTCLIVLAMIGALWLARWAQERREYRRALEWRVRILEQ